MDEAMAIFSCIFCVGYLARGKISFSSLLFFSVIDWEQGAVSVGFLGFLKFL